MAISQVSGKIEGIIVWYGEGIADNTRKQLRRNLTNALKMYMKELKSVLSKQPWGSVLAGSGTRKRVKYSPAGAPPYKQTRNLIESIRHSVIETITHLEGNVFSLAPYAMVLEKGGKLQTPASAKIFARWILRPKWGGIRAIEARPVWLPVLQKMRDKMAAEMLKNVPMPTNKGIKIKI